jgi:hypothetical protein
MECVYAKDVVSFCHKELKVYNKIGVLHLPIV